MDVLVLGAYGMLGHRLLLQLGQRFDVVGTARSIKDWNAPIMEQIAGEKIITGVDVNDISSVRAVISQTKPDVIINCIGIVKQNETSKDPIASITVNSLFPHQVARMAHDIGSQFIHFSTDCVFSGREGHYSQDHIPDPVDLYGRSKLLGEVSKNGITIRSSLIGREISSHNGLVEWLLSNRGKTVMGYRRAIFSGFPTNEMSKVIEVLLDKKTINDGVWQVATDPISKFDLLRKVIDSSGDNIELKPDDKMFCDRSLDGSPFQKITGYRAPSWDDMIDDMVKDFNLYELRG